MSESDKLTIVEIDDPLEELLVDAHGDGEHLTALHESVEDGLTACRCADQGPIHVAGRH